MFPFVIIFFAGVIILAFAAAAYVFLRRTDPAAQHSRQIIMGGRAAHFSKDTDVNDVSKRRAVLAKKLKERGADIDTQYSKKNRNNLRDRLMQAGLDIPLQKFFIGSACACLIFMGVAAFFKVGFVLIILAGVIGFFGLPRVVIGKMAKRRQKKFLEEFADALEAMTRLLKSGMPVAEAIAMVAREYNGPIGEEMSKIYDSQRIGIPLHEAAMEATRRIPLPEMKMFATGLAIQAQTGSSLSEILSNLAGVIRSRYKLARKVKALSSEAKASAGIIASLPLVVASGIYFMKPEHILVLFETPFGKVLLGGAIVWMGIGVLMMKIMINFKV